MSRLFKKKVEGKELLKAYKEKVRKAGKPLTMSRDSRALKRIFEAYDQSKSGKLAGDDAERYVRDLLHVSGLEEELWEDSMAEDDPEAAYRHFIMEVIKAIDAQGKGYIELEDLIANKAMKSDRSLSEFLHTLSEKLELERVQKALDEVIEEDVKVLREAYKSSRLLKADEIRLQKRDRRVRVPLRPAKSSSSSSSSSSSPPCTLYLALPDDPDGHLTPFISDERRRLEPEEATSLLAAVKEAAKVPSSTLSHCIDAFLLAYGKLFNVGQDAAKPAQIGEEQQSWRTRSAVHMVMPRQQESPFARDCQEATNVYGMRTVVWLPSLSSVRIRLNLGQLPRSFLADLGVKESLEVHAALSIRFDDDYTESKLFPVAATVGSLDETEVENLGVTINEQLSEILVALANQFLQKRWPTLQQPEDWPLTKLLAEGVSYEAAFEALVASHYDLEEARAWIKDEARRKDVLSKPLKAVVPSDMRDSPLLRILKAQAAKTSAHRTYSFEECIALGWRQKATAKALLKSQLKTDRALELLLEAGAEVDPDSLQALSAMKTRGPKNLILELVTILVSQLEHLSGSCLICGAHVGPNPLATDLCICTKAVCQFSHIEMGMYDTIPVQMLPVGIAADLRNDSDVVDILLTMCFSAAISGRCDQIFNPFPPMYFDEKSNKKDHASVQRLVNKMPSVDDMLQHASSEGALREYLETIEPGGRLYELILWIITVQRPPIARIPKDKRITEMPTSNQYFLMAGTEVNRRKIFREAAKKFGTYFAWHGSSIENWHAIFRVGLLNMSGSDLQTAGAAYGPGVYMAADSATSFGYAHMNASWPKSRLLQKGSNTNLQCIAIAEVAKAPGVVTVPNPYYVVPQDQYIMPRFFFIFDSHQQYGLRVMANDLKLSKYTK